MLDVELVRARLSGFRNAGLFSETLEDALEGLHRGAIAGTAHQSYSKPEGLRRYLANDRESVSSAIRDLVVARPREPTQRSLLAGRRHRGWHVIGVADCELVQPDAINSPLQ